MVKSSFALICILLFEVVVVVVVVVVALVGMPLLGKKPPPAVPAGALVEDGELQEESSVVLRSGDASDGTAEGTTIRWGFFLSGMDGNSFFKDVDGGGDVVSLGAGGDVR